MEDSVVLVLGMVGFQNHFSGEIKASSAHN